MRTCLLFLAAAVALAQPVQFDASRKVWLLTTSQSSYAIGVNPEGGLVHLYWGAPLWRLADLPAATESRDISSFDPRQMLENEEFPGWGGPRYYEPALKITREDGDRDLVLRYVSHAIREDALDITMKDIRDDIEVVLHYRLYPAYGLISRNATIANKTPHTFTLESAQSAVWNLPPSTAGAQDPGGYQLSYLAGRWAAETQLIRQPIHQGEFVLESRKGHTNHYTNPWFAIDGGATTEENGPVWFGALGWSGNWRITVEQTAYRQVRVTGGYNSFDFAYPLAPGESLDTPLFYGGFSHNGYGGASRLLHRFERERILPGGLQSRLRPVLYNSWEATTFNVSEAGQKALADKAAPLGIELFVIDDGWFGARNNDHAGLGDWVVNPQKFPNGLKPLIDHVNQLGMDFGLWVEPEMVNADSDLYRAHPDWVMNFPGRPRSELRTQLVLNLARQEVKEHIFQVLDALATAYHIRYFKWDMNRPFSEPGWPEAGPANERKIWVEYVRNYYEILDRLRARHPNLEIEDCSGGGGRIDLEVLRRADEVWTSDNTDAFDRLRIQEGFTQAFAPKIMSAWVTDVPNMNGRSTPLETRFLVAMQGALGIGANLNKWTPEDFALATRMIAAYKRVRATVQLGDLYRLASPRTNDMTVNQYVAADGRESVVFAVRHSQQYNTPAPAICPRGLDEKAIYMVDSLNGKLAGGPRAMSGAYLMSCAVNVSLGGDFDSTAIVMEKQ
jgi:alpha-galactosidase